MTDLQTWLKSGKYLPTFMRDFHDQKDVFKSIHKLYGDVDIPNPPSWIDAHVYTVDRFLWYMASRGYTLQKAENVLNSGSYWIIMSLYVRIWERYSPQYPMKVTLMCNNSWGEQDIIDGWLKDQGITLPHSVTYPLKKAVTELRVTQQKRADQAERTITEMLEQLEVRDIPGLMENGHDHIIKVCELIAQISKERISRGM